MLVDVQVIGFVKRQIDLQNKNIFLNFLLIPFISFSPVIISVCLVHLNEVDNQW